MFRNTLNYSKEYYFFTTNDGCTYSEVNKHPFHNEKQLAVKKTELLHFRLTGVLIQLLIVALHMFLYTYKDAYSFIVSENVDVNKGYYSKRTFTEIKK